MRLASLANATRCYTTPALSGTRAAAVIHSTKYNAQQSHCGSAHHSAAARLHHPCFPLSSSTSPSLPPPLANRFTTTALSATPRPTHPAFLHPFRGYAAEAAAALASSPAPNSSTPSGLSLLQSIHMMSKSQEDHRPKQSVVVIVGSTAVGKTKLSVDLATKLNGEIVNIDSMQVYSGK